MATGHQIFLYMVEQWDDSDSHAEELIALTGDYQVAQPAFEEAVRQPTKELNAPQGECGHNTATSSSSTSTS